MKSGGRRDDAGGSGGSIDTRSVDLLVDLYHRYERRLYRVCLRELGNPDDAEDAVQESFALAAPYLGRLTQDEPWRYLVTVARNVCQRESRRRARLRPLDDDDIHQMGAAEVEGPSVDRATAKRVWAQMTPREQEMVGRRYAGYNYAEIAAHLNMTVGALTMALARVRQRARHIAGGPLGGIGALGLMRLVRRSRSLARQSGGTASAQPFSGVAAVVACCVTLGASMYLWHGVPGGGVPSTGAPSPRPHVQSALQPTGPPEQASLPVASVSAAETTSVGSVPPPGSTSIAGSVASAVLPGRGATQQDVAFTSMTPSRHYQQDQTAFASGNDVSCALYPQCPVLFRTQNGGSSWQNLAAVGFMGGSVLLPPTFPSSPVIFANGSAGLQRSTDGGQTFVTVLAVAAPDALDPATGSGAPRILIAAKTPFFYDPSSMRESPGPPLPPGVLSPEGVAFGRAGDLLFVAPAPNIAEGGDIDRVVVYCPGGGDCRVTLTVPKAAAVTMVTSPTLAVDSTIVAWGTQFLYVSHDGGGTFRSIPVPADSIVQSVALTHDMAQNGVIAVDLLRIAWNGQADLMVASMSTDAGASAGAPEAGPQSWTGVLAMLILPDGRRFAAVQGREAPFFGIRCSTDGGQQWSLSC